MEQSIPQIQVKTEAETIAAIEEMQRQIELSFARMDVMEEHSRASRERTEVLLNRLEEIQAARQR